MVRAGEGRGGGNITTLRAVGPRPNAPWNRHCLPNGAFGFGSAAHVHHRSKASPKAVARRPSYSGSRWKAKPGALQSRYVLARVTNLETSTDYCLQPPSCLHSTRLMQRMQASRGADIHPSSGCCQTFVANQSGLNQYGGPAS